MPRRFSTRTSLALTLFPLCAGMLSGCGGGSGTSSAPAPAAGSSNGYTTSCANPGGMSVSTDGSPFAGRLTNVYSQGMASDTINLFLYYANNQTPGYSTRNVMGMATLTTSTLVQSGSPYGMSNGQPYSFCVTSASTTPNGQSLGSLDQSWTLNLTMLGSNLPPPPSAYSPMGYPGGYGNPGYGYPGGGSGYPGGGYGYPGGNGMQGGYGNPGYGYPGGGYGYPGGNGMQGGYGNPGYGNSGYGGANATVSIGNSQCPALVTQGRLICGGGCPCVQASVTSYGQSFAAYYISQ